MKRLFSFILALVLVLSLSVTAFAAGETGSITISNATIGQTYNLYKLFEASYNSALNAVTYTLAKDSDVYNAIFVNPGEGVALFDYEVATGEISKKSGVADQAVRSYLSDLRDDLTADVSKDATAEKVVFDGLAPGYYLVDRGITSTVTITTNMPTISILDKNQKPSGFDKLVWDEDTNAWVESSSANIGDIIKWKLPFTATNYDGGYQVQYYSIRDKKSSSLWVEFNSIEVFVNGTKLTGKGYYWCAGDNSLNTGEWNFNNNSEVWAEHPHQASWFLIHYGLDDFEIVIPWMDDFTFTGVKNLTKGYDLTFDLKTDDGNETLSEFIHKDKTTHEVVVSYTASVGPGAADANAQNSAELDWHTINGTNGPEDPEVTTVKSYKLGVTKVADDGTSSTPATRLPGAAFKLYKSYNSDTKVYSNPVYVIPTGDPGVYILDDVDTVVTGSNRTTSREKYSTPNEDAWEKYIKEVIPADQLATAKLSDYKRNDMVTPDNGQIVVMGLEAGDYYLEETAAPGGYNRLTDPVKITVGSGDVSTYDNGHSVYSKVVVNNKGTELPATGGEGTMLMVTIGTMMAIGFAVLLITQKKMSVYRD